jgi:large subunit ribosomal protein L3
MGAEQVTVQNLKVAFIDLENNVIGVTGAVPGPRKSVVIVKGVK